MPDLLKGDIFQQFAVTQVPGIVGLWTWGLVAVLQYPAVASF